MTAHLFPWLPWHSFCNSSNVKKSGKHFQKYAAQFPQSLSGKRDTCAHKSSWKKKAWKWQNETEINISIIYKTQELHVVVKIRSKFCNFCSVYGLVRSCKAINSVCSSFQIEYICTGSLQKKTDSSNPFHCSCYNESETPSFAKKSFRTLRFPRLHHSEKLFNPIEFCILRPPRFNSPSRNT